MYFDFEVYKSIYTCIIVLIIYNDVFGMRYMYIESQYMYFLILRISKEIESNPLFHISYKISSFFKFTTSWNVYISPDCVEQSFQQFFHRKKIIQVSIASESPGFAIQCHGIFPLSFL